MKIAIDDSQFDTKRRWGWPEAALGTGALVVAATVAWATAGGGSVALDRLGGQLASGSGVEPAAAPAPAAISTLVATVPESGERAGAEVATSSVAQDVPDSDAQSSTEIEPSPVESVLVVSVESEALSSVPTATPSPAPEAEPEAAVVQAVGRQNESAPSASQADGGLGWDEAADSEIDPQAVDAVEGVVQTASAETASPETASPETASTESASVRAVSASAPVSLALSDSLSVTGEITETDTATAQAEIGGEDPLPAEPAEVATPEAESAAPAADTVAETSRDDALHLPPDSLLQQRLQATQDWLQSAERSHYSIQLLLTAVGRYQNLEDFLGAPELAVDLDRVYVYETTINSRRWFGVLYRDYPTFSAAREALEQLPARLHRHGPFIRNVSDIQGHV